jgi:hypothetical protein
MSDVRSSDRTDAVYTAVAPVDKGRHPSVGASFEMRLSVSKARPVPTACGCARQTGSRAARANAPRRPLNERVRTIQARRRFETGMAGATQAVTWRRAPAQLVG